MEADIEKLNGSADTPCLSPVLQLYQTVNFKLLEFKELKMNILKFFSRKIKMMKLKRKLLRMAERRSHPQVSKLYLFSERKQ